MITQETRKQIKEINPEQILILQSLIEDYEETEQLITTNINELNIKLNIKRNIPYFFCFVIGIGISCLFIIPIYLFFTYIFYIKMFQIIVIIGLFHFFYFMVLCLKIIELFEFLKSKFIFK